MKVFKKILKFLAETIGVILLLLLIFFAVIFIKPTVIINPKNLNFALEKSGVLKSWSWTKAEMNHEWIKWNQRHFTGEFSHFCLIFEKPTTKVDTCLDDFSWDFVLTYEWGKGFQHQIKKPITIVSSKLDVLTREDPNDESPPPDLLLYWKMIWNPLVPDMNLDFKNIKIVNLDEKNKKPMTFSLKMNKRQKHMTAEALDFKMLASKEKIEIFGPKELILPMDVKTKNPLSLTELKVTADLKENNIPVSLKAKLASATLTASTVIENETLKEELGTPDFFKDVIAGSKASLIIDEINSTLRQLMKPPFNILPAPLNAMEGSLTFNLKGGQADKSETIVVNTATELNMKGKTQVLHLVVDGKIPYMLNAKKVGAISLDLDLKKVALHLPELSKTKLPPQFVPDKRIKNAKVVLPDSAKTRKKKKKSDQTADIDLELTALGEKALSLKTNLLDEILRINFDLQIVAGTLQKGFVQILPLKTTFFKRPIQVQGLRIDFNAPVEPQIKSTLLFDLPEYKITLKLEGPLSEPRQAFSSVPPLPLDDIYAVILFGRPLSNLEDEDRANAQNAGQVLSKGILSLAVLYYFAGSPVESIGYDPDAQVVSAQVGLGSKSSIRVSGEEGGLNAAGVRRSLGKGWYIDSSVQRASTNSRREDFGVLLERIISY